MLRSSQSKTLRPIGPSSSMLRRRSKEDHSSLINRARESRRAIVFPEGANPKILRAARSSSMRTSVVPRTRWAEWKIINRAEQASVDLSGIDIVEQVEDDKFKQDTLRPSESRRQRRG